MERVRSLVRRVTRGTPGSGFSTGFWAVSSMSFGYSMLNVFFSSLSAIQYGYVDPETLFQPVSSLDLDFVPITAMCALFAGATGALWSGVVQLLSRNVKAIGDFNRGYHRTSRYAPRVVWFPAYAAAAMAVFLPVRCISCVCLHTL